MQSSHFSRKGRARSGAPGGKLEGGRSAPATLPHRTDSAREGWATTKHTNFLIRAMVVALVLALAPAPLAAAGYKYKILYTFTGAADGGWPASELVFDSTGSL